MPPESQKMFAATAKDGQQLSEAERRSSVESAISALKEAAATASTEDELDIIQGKIQQLVFEYKDSLPLFRIGDRVKISEGDNHGGSIGEIIKVSEKNKIVWVKVEACKHDYPFEKISKVT